MRHLFIAVLLVVFGCENSGADDFESGGELVFYSVESNDTSDLFLKAQNQDIITSNLMETLPSGCEADNVFDYMECRGTSVLHCNDERCWFGHNCKQGQACIERNDEAYCVDIEESEWTSPFCKDLSHIVQCYGNNLGKECELLYTCGIDEQCLMRDGIAVCVPCARRA
jgi:hypothetical protein